MSEAGFNGEEVGQRSANPDAATAIIVARFDESYQLLGDVEMSKDVPQTRPMNAIIGLFVIDKYVPRCAGVFTIFLSNLSKHEDIIRRRFAPHKPRLVVAHPLGVVGSQSSANMAAYAL